LTDLIGLAKALVQRPSRLDATRLRQVVTDLVRYGLVSAVALALDCGLLFFLVSLGVHYQIAAAVSFIAGMGMAYMGSLAFVFRGRRSHRLTIEAIGFFAIGFAGLFLNQVLLFCLVSGGIGLGLAKPATAACVFMFNFTARRSLLFGLHKAVAQNWRQVPSHQNIVAMNLRVTNSVERM
jgi:putative flippase GtrA